MTEHYPTLQYNCVIEDEPLGTGGAIKLCMEKVENENVLIANGDTLFKINAEAPFNFHLIKNAECTLALKPLENFDRYGVVEISDEGNITSFKEKKFYKSGLINGGIYIINKKAFINRSFTQKFSFEKDYLEKYFDQNNFFGIEQEGYFIDIGIPGDYKKAQTDLQLPTLNLNDIDKSWTLFLDRDGVINKERVGQYVLNWEEFIFNDGTLDAFKIFSQKFRRIIIVSNQRGIGKGLMTEDDIANIHNEMQKEVEAAGSHIDAIYYCTDIFDTHFHRKPNPGMAKLAHKEFTDIDLSKAIMVGNKPSDMRFGRAAGMFTVFVTTTNPDQSFPHPDIDLIFPDLHHFARALQS